ncbi:MAG: ribose-phosphate diphosphokinase [Halofilum sp. (in: g-proteobacteria)]|nr:ribose-phosphate diphosphokinase [Halofilum sp. (in: g-proteobacteria)]
MTPAGPLVFGLGATRSFAEGVAAALGVDPAPVEERAFEDGEHKARPLIGVRDRDCHVLHSLHGDDEQTVNDKLCRLLFFAAALRDHGAARVTLVCPYLAYARKDRRTKARDPVTSRYVAQLIEAMGVDRVVVLEPHNAAAFDNALRVPAERIHARGPLADALLERLDDAPLTVVSPDTGGAKRAAAFRDLLEQRTGSRPALAFLEKQRSEGVVTGDSVSGELEGRTAVVVDDLVAGGTTLSRAAHACLTRGAVAVHAVVTHAVFASGAERLLGDEALTSLLITDSVGPRLEACWTDRVVRVSVQPLFARVIHALHDGGSINEVLDR